MGRRPAAREVMAASALAGRVVSSPALQAEVVAVRKLGEQRRGRERPLPLRQLPGRACERVRLGLATEDEPVDAAYELMRLFA